MTLKERHEKKVAELQELSKQKQQIVANLEQMNIAISRTEGAIIELYGLLQEESKKEAVMGDGTEVVE